MAAFPYVPDKGTAQNDIQSIAFGLDFEVQVAAASGFGVARTVDLRDESAGSASAEVGVFRTTANGSGGSPTSYVIKPLDPNVSVPSGFTAKSGYTTQPTAEADPVVNAVFQPYGGTGSWPVVAGAPAETLKSSAEFQKATSPKKLKYNYNDKGDLVGGELE